MGGVGPGGIPAAAPGTPQHGQQPAAVTGSGVAGANASGKDVTAAAAAGMGGSIGGMSMADWEAVVALYKDALGFYRAVMAAGAIELEKQSWWVKGSHRLLPRIMVGGRERGFSFLFLDLKVDFPFFFLDVCCHVVRFMCGNDLGRPC